MGNALLFRLFKSLSIPHLNMRHPVYFINEICLAESKVKVLSLLDTGFGFGFVHIVYHGNLRFLHFIFLCTLHVLLHLKSLLSTPTVLFCLTSSMSDQNGLRPLIFRFLSQIWNLGLQMFPNVQVHPKKNSTNETVQILSMWSFMWKTHLRQCVSKCAKIYLD